MKGFSIVNEAFDCSVDHNKLENSEMGVPEHLTCFLRNLFVSQEATVRTRHKTTDWFKIEERVGQDCILSPYLFDLYAEYLMKNTGLEETQAGIKIAWRNINNLRYTNDTALMAESEELKSLLMKVREESEKASLKPNIKKRLRSWYLVSGSITSWQMGREKVETVTGFLFLGSKITADGDCSHEVKRCLLLERNVITNLDSIF